MLKFYKEKYGNQKIIVMVTSKEMWESYKKETRFKNFSNNYKGSYILINGNFDECRTYDLYSDRHKDYKLVPSEMPQEEIYDLWI